MNVAWWYPSSPSSLHVTVTVGRQYHLLNTFSKSGFNDKNWHTHTPFFWCKVSQHTHTQVKICPLTGEEVCGVVIIWTLGKKNPVVMWPELSTARCDYKLIFVVSKVKKELSSSDRSVTVYYSIARWMQSNTNGGLPQQSGHTRITFFTYSLHTATVVVFSCFITHRASSIRSLTNVTSVSKNLLTHSDCLSSIVHLALKCLSHPLPCQTRLH